MLSPTVVRFWRHEPRNRELGYEIIYFALPSTLSAGKHTLLSYQSSSRFRPCQFLQIDFAIRPERLSAASQHAPSSAVRIHLVDLSLCSSGLARLAGLDLLRQSTFSDLQSTLLFPQ
jgi:hypothetical protein